MIIGKSDFISNNKYPIRWQYYKTYKRSEDVYIIEPGWYRIHVVGAGGNGGRGGRARTADSRTGASTSSGGSSGSTGAYVIHDVLLRYNDIIYISIDTTPASGGYGSSKAVLSTNTGMHTLFAACGINGVEGNENITSSNRDSYADPVYPLGVSGVVATGGNVRNLPGVIGNASRQNTYGYQLGGLGSVQTDHIALYTPKQGAEGNAASGDYLLGGSGAGGKGVSTYNTQWQYGNDGGYGGMAGVVIERGEYK